MEAEKEGFFPFTVKGRGFGCNEISVDIEHSSQFLSALLISSVLFQEDFSINVTGDHGMAYVDMTIAMMEQFGAKVEKLEGRRYICPKENSYACREYGIEPDIMTVAKALGCGAPVGAFVLNEKTALFETMPVGKALLTMAIPTIISQLITMIYNLADTYFVGKLGVSASGAIGVIFTLMASRLLLQSKKRRRNVEHQFSERRYIATNGSTCINRKL